MSIYKNIENEVERLEVYLNYEDSGLDRLISEAEVIGRSWSGSWLGYHSRVYYENFNTPPPGAHFSIEWGIYGEYGALGMGSVGSWVEYNYADIIDYIEEKSGRPDLTESIKISEKLRHEIDDIKNNILSIIHAKNTIKDDIFFQKLIAELEGVKISSQADFLKSLVPKGGFSTRDQRVEHKILAPAHLNVQCKVYEIKSIFISAEKLKKISLRISGYIKNLEGGAVMSKNNKIGYHVFIGHGRSQDWRDLKDFIGERLKLQWDEFNRVPVAGLTNITRLSQMLDQSCIAFLVMTAEDEQMDGNQHARMNVLHEVGLFQGRLGFEKAIILLEEGCEEFSNIQGLGQIRYPKGKINMIFEDVRQVLEREGII